jgi:hypothetical protein
MSTTLVRFSAFMGISVLEVLLVADLTFSGLSDLVVR